MAHQFKKMLKQSTWTVARVVATFTVLAGLGTVAVAAKLTWRCAKIGIS